MNQIARLDAAGHPWMYTEGLRRIFRAIKDGGGEARFVGGCIRDALLGQPVNDIDLAVNLSPQKVTELLVAAGLKVVPTGIDHGTVTAVADHKGYEMTSLRRDLKTDGRRAKVAFTDDWQADAARRDFTINAIYADAEGQLYDYFEGRADLEERRVRFIGDAAKRIEEDVLRILRFFRFHAWFGSGDPDPAGLAACKRLAQLLPRLSAERVWRELKKWLEADNPVPALQWAVEQDILPKILPEGTHVKRLSNLLASAKRYAQKATQLTRLAALLNAQPTQAEHVAKRLKLSKDEAQTLGVTVSLAYAPAGFLSEAAFPALLYRVGAERAQQALLLHASIEVEADFSNYFSRAAAWKPVQFPLHGGDLLKLGLQPGPELGAVLKSVEAWWIEQQFRPTGQDCLKEAQRRANK